MIRTLLVLTTALLLAPNAASAQVEFDFIAPTQYIAFTPGETDFEFTISFDIHQTSGPLVQTLGFAMGCAHDSDVLDVEEITYGSAIFVDPWGQPDFFATAVFDGGWTAGVAYSHTGSWSVPFPIAEPAIDVTFTAIAPFVGQSTDLTWTDTLGIPAVSNSVQLAIIGPDPNLVDGLITFGPSPYVRGDMNTDGVVDIADVFTAEDYLFLGGEEPQCVAALDSNNDDQLDIADLIFLLSYLFLSGDEPQAPFPNCGPAPDDIEFGCESSACP